MHRPKYNKGRVSSQGLKSYKGMYRRSPAQMGFHGCEGNLRGSSLIQNPQILAITAFLMGVVAQNLSSCDFPTTPDAIRRLPAKPGGWYRIADSTKLTLRCASCAIQVHVSLNDISMLDGSPKMTTCAKTAKMFSPDTQHDTRAYHKSWITPSYGC